jgi:hypothetical protein
VIERDKLVKGRVYKLFSRNLRHGVYDGDRGFIGIRTKFGDRYLFTEYIDDGGMYGTVTSAEDMVVQVPEIVTLDEDLGTIDEMTGREVAFDKPVSNGGRGWYYTDTGEANQGIKPANVPNRRLFGLLDEIEKGTE